MRNIVKILVFLAIATLLVGLAMLNADRRVSLTYLPGATIHNVPVSLVILGSMFAGVLIAGVVSLVDQVRVRQQARGRGRQIAELERELRELRNRPLDSMGDETPSPGGDH